MAPENARGSAVRAPRAYREEAPAFSGARA
ncbi:hypothetical protein M2319_003103 [Rhodobium gokarnense]|uniref:Uncharacterized protein n=1 Tax=Rhodobium gokarnense TaxID=364296 RepID=A0ABT3HED2_9HYPH|nr:hypothetical protein [Rhodobium gokarnense]